MKILVYEKIRILDEAIKGILKGIDFVESVDYAVNDEEFIKKLTGSSPDLLMIGNVLSELSQREKQLIETKRPGLKMLSMVNEDDRTNVMEDIQNGVDGYIMLNWSKAGLEKALGVFKNEGILFPHKMVLTLIEDMRKAGPLNNTIKKLSKMEIKILRLLCKGKQNKEIAVLINKSDRVVKNYLKTIYLKIGASNRTEAVSLVLPHLKDMFD